MSLLMPETGLLFWMFLCFGIVFFLLAKFGFPVITRMVDERRAYIEESLRVADDANAQLAGIKAEARQILSQAQARQLELINEAKSAGEKIIAQAHAKAAEQTSKQLEAAEQLIEQKKKEALRDIRTQVAMLSVEIAEKVLRSKLDNREEQTNMILRMLDETQNTIES